MEILVIAPTHPDLPNQPDEVAKLASDLDATLIQGVVTEREIMTAIRQRKTYAGVWISSHANNEGVLLSEGILDVPALAQYLSAMGARWVVFNSCEGYEFVDKLQQFYPVDVVAASVKGLADLSAWRTAVLIARSLGKTGNLREALRKASPGGAAPFRFWPNPAGETETTNERKERETVQGEQALRLEIKSVREDLHQEIDNRRESDHETAIVLTRFEGRIQTIENMYAALQKEPSLARGPLRLIMISLWLLVALVTVGLFMASRGIF